MNAMTDPVCDAWCWVCEECHNPDCAICPGEWCKRCDTRHVYID